jgi:Peptidase family M28
MIDMTTLSKWQMPLVCMLLLATWVIRPFGVDAPSATVSDFNTAKAHASLVRILGNEKPHPADSDALDEVRARLLTEISELGFTPNVGDQFYCNDVRAGAAICGRVRNISFWITPLGKDAVMISAHYDSVPAGPGAADDGMGVAIALETARVVKDEKPDRPILVLLTDAEEAGLNGAAAFAATDPLAKQIGAIVNLEARGTTGQVKLFETSTPNGNDFAAVRRGDVVPSANSMSGDLYAVLPNYTDLTMLLKLPVDAANYSVIGGASRYHTPLDNLDHLDRRSMAQMGANALSAVRGFAASPADSIKALSEQNSIYADVVGLFWIGIPQSMALIALLMGFVASTLLFAKQAGSAPWRTGFAPLIACIAGTGAAIATGLAVAAIRPEASFATAHPEALRFAFGAAALLGATITIAALRINDSRQLNAAAWIWFSLLSLALYPWLPSFSIYMIVALLPIAAAAIAHWKWSKVMLVRWLLIAAALAYAVMALPAVFGAEDALFIENAAPLTILLVFLFLFLLPQNVAGRFAWASVGLCLIIFVLSLATTLLVPAFSPDTPRHLSLLHEDIDGKGRVRVYDNGALPNAILANAKFASAPDRENYWNALAPSLRDEGSIEIISDKRSGEFRVLHLQLTAPHADRIELKFDKGNAIAKAEINGAKPAVIRPIRNIGCSGRDCQKLLIRLEFDRAQPVPSLSWVRHYIGYSTFTAQLAAKRPHNSQPAHGADQMSVIRNMPVGWLSERGR